MARSDHDTIVVGAGLAGLACAHRLLDHGRSPLVLEANDYVGGRTASWMDDGMPVESGLHRFLGFYRELPKLLEACGVRLDDIVFWEDELVVRPAGVREGRFGVSPVFRPFRTLTGALGNNHLLSPADKARLARFLLAGLRDYVRRPAALDRQDLEGYGRRHGLNDRCVEHVLFPGSAGIFFLPPDRYSAYAFFAMIAKAVRRPHRLRLGAFEGGMTDVMSGPLAAAVARRGGAVRTGTAVRELQLSGGAVVGVLLDGEPLAAREVVVATPVNTAQRLLRAHFADQEWCRPLLRMQTMSAATIQLELSRPAYPLDRTIFGPGTVMASFAEQSRTTFKHSRGRLSIILTPPERFVGMAPDRVFEIVMADARRLGLDIESAVTDYRVVLEPDEFYELSPGQHPLRPDQRTPVPGLTLAGGYTRQAWIDTMEGAVISGRIAADIAHSGTRPAHGSASRNRRMTGATASGPE